MSSDKRQWRCPECGTQVELSIFQLDPLACDACLAKRKSGGSAAKSNQEPAATGSNSAASTSPLAAIPDLVKIGGALIVGLILGLPVGFIAGRLTAPQASTDHNSGSSRNSTERESIVVLDVDDKPDESTRPGPGYKWVKGYTRKDGATVKGHWAKDSKRK